MEYYLDKEDAELLEAGLQRELEEELRQELKGEGIVVGIDTQGIDKTRRQRNWEKRDIDWSEES